MSEIPYDLDSRIANDFTFHPQNELTGPLHDKVRETLKLVAYQLCELVPVGREQSLMLTQLEQAMMWANAGIARQS